jgi:ferredoxin
VRLRVDGARCVGHGRCYELAPEVFDEDVEGHCVARFERLPAGLEAPARAGEANCPERAIELLDDETGRGMPRPASGARQSSG